MFKRELIRILQLFNTNNIDNMKHKKNLNQILAMNLFNEYF